MSCQSARHLLPMRPLVTQLLKRRRVGLAVMPQALQMPPKQSALRVTVSSAHHWRRQRLRRSGFAGDGTRFSALGLQRRSEGLPAGPFIRNHERFLLA